MRVRERNRQIEREEWVRGRVGRERWGSRENRGRERGEERMGERERVRERWRKREIDR